MKTTILCILTIFLLGCTEVSLEPRTCEQRILTIGLPDQIKQQGLNWAQSLPIGERILIEKCYAITRRTQTLYEAELLC